MAWQKIRDPARNHMLKGESRNSDIAIKPLQTCCLITSFITNKANLSHLKIRKILMLKGSYFGSAHGCGSHKTRKRRERKKRQMARLKMATAIAATPRQLYFGDCHCIECFEKYKVLSEKYPSTVWLTMLLASYCEGNTRKSAQKILYVVMTKLKMPGKECKWLHLSRTSIPRLMRSQDDQRRLRQESCSEDDIPPQPATKKKKSCENKNSTATSTLATNSSITIINPSTSSTATDSSIDISARMEGGALQHRQKRQYQFRYRINFLFKISLRAQGLCYAATIKEDVLQVFIDDIATLHNKFYLTSSEYDILAGSIFSTFPKLHAKGKGKEIGVLRHTNTG
ncbi:hypothetical protein CAPTEDRAFT_186927 [Capitella teleta]|uniref:Uncharacterized protein n=1 Tax=Capitella teleta TaxID=283909 RepID=R7TNA1_CAPTE|nr:hypothetical protein CAPTEDRAFT_186927 [Capitella teleta]|eukprot:ELT92560.1 hypothetical protein CAPTEDRAFT_186927 [Capitella teleta]